MFIPQKNFIDDAERVLQVKNDEIPFEKVLSKEERNRLE